jgi:hypothetical protein
MATTMNDAARHELRKRYIIFFVTAPIFFGLFSVALGRDANWDLQNYHWYNPYALLTGRISFDLAPAGPQTFLTPLFDIPWFVLASFLPGAVIGFLLGAVQSINLILLYFIAHRLLPFEDWRRRNLVALLVALAGMLGGGSIGLLGTTFQDNVTSIGVLGSLLAVLANSRRLEHGSRLQTARYAVLSSIPVGVAVAGKLTAAPYATGLALALLFLPTAAGRRIWAFLWFCGGVAACLVLLFGPWVVFLTLTAAGPIFSYMPRGGSLISPFHPRGWLEAAVYPLVFSLDPHRVSEVEFRDFRIATAYVLVPALLLAGWWWDRRRLYGLRYVLAATTIAYVLWLAVFSIYRYAVAIEMLAPLLIAALMAQLPFSAKLRAFAISLVMLLLSLSAWPPDWGRGRWSRGFVEAAAPPIERPAEALVLLLDRPLAYLVPTFNPKTSFVGLPPDLARIDDQQSPWNKRLRDRLKDHAGELYGVVGAPRDKGDDKRGEARQLLAAYDLALDINSCRPIHSNMEWTDSMTLCDAFDFLGLDADRARCRPTYHWAPPELCRIVRLPAADQSVGVSTDAR